MKKHFMNKESKEHCSNLQISQYNGVRIDNIQKEINKQETALRWIKDLR